MTPKDHLKQPIADKLMCLMERTKWPRCSRFGVYGLARRTRTFDGYLTITSARICIRVVVVKDSRLSNLTIPRGGATTGKL